ncbi:hypothetical protein [Prevotella sp.]|uniref:hypothetical protein n=1 Tax=Prevotella sp. TaxID=59823 RepID=UPI003077B657
MEIKQLIDRYMNGQTTVDEEQLLARYFRSATDLPDDLQPYRDMFAYFDEGMPLGALPYFDEGMPLGALPEFDGSAGQAETRVAPDSSKVVAPRRRSLHMAAWWSGAAAVAAAVALLLIIHRPSAPVQPIASAVVVSDTCSTSTGVEAEQNVVTDSVKLKPQPQRRRPSVRRRYYLAPPKTYLAHAAATDSITHEANANMNGSATDCLVAIHELSEAERQSIERDIRESLRLVDEVRNTLLAVDMLNQIDDEAADEQY